MLIVRKLPSGWIIDGPGGAQGPYPSLKDTLRGAQDMIRAMREIGVEADLKIEA